MSLSTQTRTYRPHAAVDSQTLANLIEQLNEELDQGSAVDLEDLIAAHPQHEQRLRDLVPTMIAMASWGKAPVDQTNGECRGASSSSLPGVLGDFRILGELGRGGMGAVYEAEQISMGRRVALKVLPFAALAHGKALQRFRNEVRAAAALDHPHIVSVYSVGEERGIHYYSMQLIHGQSLAETIDQTRADFLDSRTASTNAEATQQPVGNEDLTLESSSARHASTIIEEQALIRTAVNSTRDSARYRNAAFLGVQAAGALQHAHDQGVLHRDIKPGNLMIDRDGALYVADFGLARIESDAGMTMTGDIVGTLRYMAPEQALAKRVVIDHRADVYALGATLYELLTLQPVFGETDRSELLKRIAFDEPTPLRKLDRRIPVELETIVLKALSKSAEDRYQTALELADDLQAYLDHRPILAKAPTFLDHALKWSKRNNQLAAVIAIALLGVTIIALIAASTSAKAFTSEQRQRQIAESATKEARVQREAALDALEAESKALQDSNRNLYQAHVREAHELLQQGNTRRAESLLFQYLPWDSDKDLRDWEWYYLYGQTDRGELISADGTSPRSIRFSPTGRNFATASAIHVRLWDANAKTLMEERVLPLDDYRLLSYSPDGECLAIRSIQGGLATIWNLQSGVLRTIPLPDGERTSVLPEPAWSPDAKQLAIGAYKNVIIWDVEQDRVVTTFQFKEPVKSVAWRPNESELAIGWGGALTLLNVTTGDRRYEEDLHKHDLWTLDWSSDGRLLATGAFNQHALIIDAESGEVLHDFAHHSGVTDVKFSPDETCLACATAGGAIRLWDLKSGRPHTLTGHRK